MKIFNDRHSIAVYELKGQGEEILVFQHFPRPERLVNDLMDLAGVFDWNKYRLTLDGVEQRMTTACNPNRVVR